MKPLNKKNYGSIPHLLGSKLGKTDKYIHEGQHKILTEKTRDKHDFIIVTEKYDGSNVGIAKVNKKIIAITRSGYLAETSPYKQHYIFAKWVESQKDRFDFIGEGERLVGEWLLQVHSIKYKIKGEPFIAFDYFTKENKRLSFYDFNNITILPNILIPNVIHANYSAFSTDNAMKELNKRTSGNFYSENPEGVVYRIERKGKFDFAAKFVRSDFEAGKYCVGVDEANLMWNCPLSNCL